MRIVIVLMIATIKRETFLKIMMHWLFILYCNVQTRIEIQISSNKCKKTIANTVPLNIFNRSIFFSYSYISNELIKKI